MRFSPFDNCSDDTESLREFEGAAWTEQWFASYEGGISTINAYFAAIEAEFIGLRKESQSNSYDELMLDVWRSQKAAELLVRAKAEFHPYIQERAKLPCELPPIVERSLDEILGVESVVA